MVKAVVVKAVGVKVVGTMLVVNVLVYVWSAEVVGVSLVGVEVGPVEVGLLEVGLPEVGRAEVELRLMRMLKRSWKSQMRAIMRCQMMKWIFHPLLHSVNKGYILTGAMTRELRFFHLFFTREIITSIATNSNIYATTKVSQNHIVEPM